MKKIIILLFVFFVGSVFWGLNRTEETVRVSDGYGQDQQLLQEIFKDVKDTNPLEFAEEVYTAPGFKKLSIETQETLKAFLQSPEFIKIQKNTKKVFGAFVQSPQFEAVRQKVADDLSREKVYEEGKKAGQVIRSVLNSQAFQSVQNGIMQNIKAFMGGIKRE